MRARLVASGKAFLGALVAGIAFTLAVGEFDIKSLLSCLGVAAGLAACIVTAQGLGSKGKRRFMLVALALLVVIVGAGIAVSILIAR